MRAIHYIVLVFSLLLLPMWASAEVLVLKSGETVRGTIVFENEQVVVVKQSDGSRFQYLRSDIERIVADAEMPVQQEEKQEVVKVKKVTTSLQLSGGASCLPGDAGGSDAQWGPAFGADLFIGSHSIAGRTLCIGGSIGYRQTLSPVGPALPIQLRIEMPLLQTAHAPLVALSAGYAVALKSGVKGGGCGEALVGWRWQFNPNRAMAIGLFTDVMQARINMLEETIDGISFVRNHATRTVVSFGLKAAIYL